MQPYTSSSSGGDQQGPTFVPYLLPDRGPYRHPSECVDPHELATLIGSVADRQISQLCRPILLYSSNQHGTRLQTLYAKAADWEENAASLLLVRSSSGQTVVAAFCTQRWEGRAHKRGGYFGTGLSYIAHVRPAPINIYRWVGRRTTTAAACDQFQLSSMDALQVGGPGPSGGHPGIGLDAQLSVGISGHSPTFDNPPLVPSSDCLEGYSEGGAFSVGLVELIGFETL